MAAFWRVVAWPATAKFVEADLTLTGVSGKPRQTKQRALRHVLYICMNWCVGATLFTLGENDWVMTRVASFLKVMCLHRSSSAVTLVPMYSRDPTDTPLHEEDSTAHIFP